MVQIFCLVHKMDLVPEENRQELFEERREELEKIAEVRKFVCRLVFMLCGKQRGLVMRPIGSSLPLPVPSFLSNANERGLTPLTFFLTISMQPLTVSTWILDRRVVCMYSVCLTRSPTFLPFPFPLAFAPLFFFAACQGMRCCARFVWAWTE